MLQKLLLILCVFSLYSCRASKTFVNPEKEESIQMLNEKMQDKEMLIFKLEADSSFRAEQLRMTSDSIYYGTHNKKALPLSDIHYLKNTPEVNKVALIAGLGLMGLGVYKIGAARRDESYDSLGKGLGGVAFLNLGLGISLAGIITRDRFYYFREGVEIKFEDNIRTSCNFPRCRKGY